MFVLSIPNNLEIPVIVEPVVEADYRKITKERYFFSWRKEKTELVYKLITADVFAILGLISIACFDEEYRIEIRLLAVEKSQVGSGKTISRIAGCLFAFAAKQAIKKYGPYAAISLVPKTELGQHYMDAYGFEQAGKSLYLEGKQLLALIKRFGNG